MYRAAESPPTRLRPRTLALLLLCSLRTLPLHAAALSSCEPSDSVLLCRLRTVLTGLRTIAGILAVLLLAAVLIAVRAYRRKPRKLTPDDITPDAD